MVGVDVEGTVVGDVEDAVFIQVVTRIADFVARDVFLFRIGRRGTVVDGIANAVAIGVEVRVQAQHEALVASSRSAEHEAGEAPQAAANREIPPCGFGDSRNGCRVEPIGRPAVLGPSTTRTV